MMLIDVVLIALSVALVVSFVDRWLTWWNSRGLVALGLAIGGGLVFDYSGWMLVMVSTGAAFLTLIMILIGERLATPAPVVLNRRA